MNIVDYICLAVIAVSALFGAYSGLITTTLNTCAFFISWLVSTLIYPNVTRMILGYEQIMTTVGIYADGAAHISSQEIANIAVDSIPIDEIAIVVAGVDTPAPLGDLLASNIQDKVFHADGLTTLSQYYDNTLFAATINILSFLITLTAVFFIITIVISAIQYVVKFPQLKVVDGLVGAAVGCFRGFFALYALYMLAPIFLSLLPGELSSSILQQSVLTNLFYPENPMLSSIRGYF